MVLLQRTRASAPKQVTFRADAAQIRKGANMLPVKSMLYAISHAMADPSIKAEAKSESARRRVSGMSKHFSRLYLLASDYGTQEQTRPSGLFSVITSAVHSYVNLFYSIKSSNRSSYIERNSRGSACRRVNPEGNLLLMPAIMAERGERRGQVHSAIIRSLYSMPARFLRDKSRAAMKVEALQQGLGLKGARESALSRLSLSMAEVESLIERIGNGVINPEGDEMVKELFVNEMVAVSESEDMGLAEFVSDKLSSGNVSFEIGRRLIRK